MNNIKYSYTTRDGVFKICLLGFLVLFCFSQVEAGILFRESWEDQVVYSDLSELLRWEKSWPSMENVTRGSIVFDNNSLRLVMQPGDDGNTDFAGVKSNFISIGTNTFYTEFTLQGIDQYSSDYVYFCLLCYDGAENSLKNYRLMFRPGLGGFPIYLQYENGADNWIDMGSVSNIGALIGVPGWSPYEITRYGLYVNYGTQKLTVSVNGIAVLVVSDSIPSAINKTKISLATSGPGTYSYDGIECFETPWSTTVSLPLSTLRVGGNRFGLTELWWYQLAEIFTVGTTVDVSSESSRKVTLDAEKIAGFEDPYFGYSFVWSNFPFRSFYKYVWTMQYSDAASLPDFITVNDDIVWHKADGFATNDLIEFEYVFSNDEEAKIRLIWEMGGLQNKTAVIRHKWWPNSLVCVRQEQVSVIPQYDQYPIESSTVFVSIDPNLGAQYNYDFEEPVDYGPELLVEMPYETDQVVFMERIAPTLSQIQWLNALTGINTMTFQVGEPTSFDEWMNLMLSGGIRDLVVFPPIRSGSAPDSYISTHMGGTEVLSDPGQMAENAANVMKAWLNNQQDANIYMFYPEMNGMFGNYGGGIFDTLVNQSPGYEDADQGGRIGWERTFDFFNDFRSELETNLGAASDRLKVVANFDRVGFQGAYAHKSGVDIIIHKCIHRQSINLVVANSRGAAKAYDKEYGYDFDAWDRNWWVGYAPKSIKHGLETYFHAGGKYFMDEVSIWSRDGIKPTAWGKGWLDFCRYASRHPKRGSQEVKIGILRAYGDEWNRVAGPASMNETIPHLPIDEMWTAWGQNPRPYTWYWAAVKMPLDWDELIHYTYLWDYDLLNVVFSSYGSPYRTNINKLCTGTPYGPVDFIPWDITQDKLNTYSIIVHLGRGVGVDINMIGRLEQFVSNGGTVILAAGQLRDDNGDMAVSSFCGINLGSTQLLNNENPYTVLSNGTVLEDLSTGDPLAVEKGYGSGKAIMFSGEWVCDKDVDFAKAVFQQELVSHKWLEFTPSNDWLEYFVSQRNDLWILTVFNHGRGYYPSGNGVDNGVWSGDINVDLNKLGLEAGNVEVFGVSYDTNSTIPFTLLQLPISNNGSSLLVPLTVDEFKEIVIGPVGLTALEYFCKQTGDLNRDCCIDVNDLEIFAKQWLDGPGCVGHPADCADLVGGDGVNLADFAQLTENWSSPDIASP